MASVLAEELSELLLEPDVALSELEELDDVDEADRSLEDEWSCRASNESRSFARLDDDKYWRCAALATWRPARCWLIDR